MAPDGELSIESIMAFLEAPAIEKSVGPKRSPEQVQAYREAAAVLAAVQNPDALKPVGRSAIVGGATLVIGEDLVPATGRKFAGKVMLAPDVRTDTLRELVSAGRIQDALAANPAERTGSIQQRLEQYILGSPPDLASQSLADLSETQQVVIWLRDIVPGVPSEEEVEQRASYLRLIAPFESIAGDGVFRGRKKELDELRSYIGVVAPESFLKRLQGLFKWAEPERQPAVDISGPGGVGKSALVARFMLEHTRLRDDMRVPFAYLDFDRASLDVGNPVGLCVEMVRQLDSQFPGEDRFGSLRSFADKISADVATSAENQIGSARSLLADLLGSMRTKLGPRPYVVVLDTFEEVQYRGEARAEPLWDMLTQLQIQAPFLRVVISGRAPVESLRLAGKPPHQIILGDLDEESALAFLEAQGVTDDKLRKRLVGAFGRMPLSLKLASSLVTRGDVNGEDLLSETSSGGAMVAVSDELIQGQLYQRILDHIKNVQVRRLAHPGLVLRRINPDIILEVLNEPCSLGLSTIEQARDLFGELQKEVSLVTLDEVDGDLVHRADLRRIMLKLLVESAPLQVEQIRRGAIHWYQGQETRRAKAEEVYHRLHLGEQVDSRDLADREVRASVQSAMVEFPIEIQLRLATLGFDVPADVQKLASQEQQDASIAAQIEELLPYGSSSITRAQDMFAPYETGLDRASPLFRTGARLAMERLDPATAGSFIERGLELSIRDGRSDLTLGLLQERAWLRGNLSPSEQADGLSQLAGHAQRHLDRGAQLQYLAQTVDKAADDVDAELDRFAEVLTKAQPLDIWNLVPALLDVVDVAAARRLSAILDPLQLQVFASGSPFHFAVFPDPASQRLLEAVQLAPDRGPEAFAKAFLTLAGGWPYRILFVAPPYGRQGEQLSESAS
jgi:hypothetical protein